MGFARRRARLELTEEVRREFAALARAREEPARRVERARILLAYAEGEPVSSIARRLASKAELVERIELYLEEINRSPVIHRWTYGLEAAAVA